MAESQIGGRSTEISLSCRLHAVGEVSVVDLVEIQLEDFIFGVATGNFGGEQDLANLAQGGSLGAFFGREQQVARDLLGNGRGARNGLTLSQVLPDGTGDRGRVEPGIAVKGRILGSDEGAHHVRRDLIQRDIRAAPRLRIKDFVKQIALPVQDAGRFELSRMLLQIPDRRQGRGEGVVLIKAERGDSNRHRDDCEQAQNRHAQQASTRSTPLGRLTEIGFPDLQVGCGRNAGG